MLTPISPYSYRSASKFRNKSQLLFRTHFFYLVKKCLQKRKRFTRNASWKSNTNYELFPTWWTISYLHSHLQKENNILSKIKRLALSSNFFWILTSNISFWRIRIHVQDELTGEFLLSVWKKMHCNYKVWRSENKELTSQITIL